MKIQLQRGIDPWQGHGHSEMVEQYHYHDMPLIGVLVQDGAEYLFRCETGEIEPVNFWTYTPLTPSARKALERTEGDAFDDAVDELAENAEALAIAIDGYGIVVWNHLDADNGREATVKMLMNAAPPRGRGGIVGAREGAI